jgi:hypothetical protein
MASVFGHSLTADAHVFDFRFKKNLKYTFSLVLFSFINCLPLIKKHNNNQRWMKYLK